MIEFFVEGNPVPKQSFKMGKHGGYQPKRVTDWQETVGWTAKSRHRGEPTDKRYAVKLIFYRKGKRKVDCGNLDKPVLDAMQGIIYIDDEQVDDMHVKRFYNAARPGVMVTVKELE